MGGAECALARWRRWAPGRKRRRWLWAHRLDRDTSGVLLLAKRRAALRHLQQAFRERTVQKRYLAVVAGSWPAHLSVSKPPGASAGQQRGALRARVSGREPAQTGVSVAERLPGATLLALTPETGRTHQLRVHLSHAGFPILGDEKYAPPGLRKALGTVPCEGGWRFMPKR